MSSVLLTKVPIGQREDLGENCILTELFVVAIHTLWKGFLRISQVQNLEKASPSTFDDAFVLARADRI